IAALPVLRARYPFYSFEANWRGVAEPFHGSAESTPYSAPGGKVALGGGIGSIWGKVLKKFIVFMVFIVFTVIRQAGANEVRKERAGQGLPRGFGRQEPERGLRMEVDSTWIAAG
ncbi:MAG: hypothetical protein ACE5H2_09755, partial [Terriglobia bacterium]